MYILHKFDLVLFVLYTIRCKKKLFAPFVKKGSDRRRMAFSGRIRTATIIHRVFLVSIEYGVFNPRETRQASFVPYNIDAFRSLRP